MNDICCLGLGMVVYACNLSTWEGNADSRNSRPALAGYTVSSKVQDECGLHEILSQNKALLFQSVGDNDTAIRYNYITDKDL